MADVRGRETRSADRLLLDERPLMVQPTLAAIFGLPRAVILQEIYWLTKQPNSGRVIDRVVLPDERVIENARWIWNTAEQWQVFFSWLPVDSIRKHLAALEADGVLATYQRADRDRTKHYTVDREQLSAWIDGWHEARRIREDDKRKKAAIDAIPSGKNRHMEAAKIAGCIRQDVESLQPAIFAASSITQNSHTEMSGQKGERAPRAAPADLDSAVPASLKNQSPPQRKPRTPKLSSANITLADNPDPRVVDYLNIVRGSITETNAAMICERVGMDHTDIWRHILTRWVANEWNPTNFAGMFDAFDRAVNGARVRAANPQAVSKQREQPQQFGIGGELYRAAVAAGFDLSELQVNEVSIGN